MQRMMAFRGWASCGALLFGIASSLGCSSEDPDLVKGEWDVEGVDVGTVTLTETYSGRTWSFGGNGSYLRSKRAIEFERRGERWAFEYEIDSPEPFICHLFDETGRYDEIGEWRIGDDGEEVYPFLRCGRSLDSLDFDDPGLAACVADVDRFPPTASRSSTATINVLDCSERGIEDLSGLHVFYRLYALDVSGNALTSLSRTDLPAITFLDVSHNDLTTIDVSILRDDFGRTLVAAYNRIASVTGWESAGIYFETLDLSHNALETFGVPGYVDPGDPASAPEPREVAVLDLSHNELGSVDLSHVGVADLDVSWNDLTALDLSASPASFAAERRVDASHNLLTEQQTHLAPRDLPDGSSLLSLYVPAATERFDVSHNLLGELPPGFIGTGTTELLAQGNELESVDLADATRLRVLDLSHNRLDSVDLGGSESLASLDLSGNLLTAFGWSEQTDLLEELDLSGNPLSALAECDAPLLWSLFADDASISSFDPAGCPRLVELGLAGNQLTTIDLAGNPDLEWVDLSDNPLACQAAIDASIALPDAELVLPDGICPP